MKIDILRGPAFLLEALDAIRIVHHRLPLDAYTRDSVGGIPPREAERIVTEAYEALDASDPALHYYFQPWKLEVDPLRMACLANYMIYSWPDISFGDPEQAAAQICRNYHDTVDGGFVVSSVSGTNLDLNPCPENRDLSVEQVFEKPPLPEGLRRELVTVFSNFDRHMERLTKLLLPAIRRLETLLEPWVQSLMPTAERWERELAEEGPERLLEHSTVSTLNHLLIRMRYLDERSSYAAVDPVTGTGHFYLQPHTAVTSRGLSGEASVETMLSSLRLMGDRTRMEMLQLMLDKPYYCNELAEKLNVNSGIVFRNINSLVNCRMISKKEIGGKLCYFADPSRIRELLHSVERFLAL